MWQSFFDNFIFKETVWISNKYVDYLDEHEFKQKLRLDKNFNEIPSKGRSKLEYYSSMDFTKLIPTYHIEIQKTKKDDIDGINAILRLPKSQLLLFGSGIGIILIVFLIDLITSNENTTGISSTPLPFIAPFFFYFFLLIVFHIYQPECVRKLKILFK